MNEKPRFVVLKAINGEPIVVNLAAVRTVSTIEFAGDHVGVIAFDKDHEVVIGSTVEEFLTALAAAPARVGD